MPSIRIGFSTDFNLTSEQVGIGTTLPSARLDVAGQILSDNSSGSGGVSTVTRYDGFLGSEQRVTSNISIAQTTKGNLNSLSGEIVIEDEVTVTDDTPLTGGRLDSLTVTGKFDLPHGGTGDREDTPEKGSTRFNQDLGQLEFYTGYEWRTTLSYDGSGRGRGVIASGNGAPLAASFLNSIEFINISSTGNSLNFGDITSVPRQGSGGCSSSTRGLFGGGYNGPAGGLFNNIDYITIQSEGNSIDFGDLTISVSNRSACSSSTRGVWGGGASPTNVIEYVEIETLGNSIDFGDLSLDRQSPTGLSSPTRGIFGGGTKNPLAQSLIDFITIASKGNAIKFGDLTQIGFAPIGCSNSVRGLFGGGYVPSPAVSLSKIDYITIASEGNAINFGNLTVARNWGGGVSTQTRGVFMSGRDTPSTRTNAIDFVNIASTGDAQDFGDLSIGRQGAGACSDSHGGLGGF